MAWVLIIVFTVFCLNTQERLDAKHIQTDNALTAIYSAWIAPDQVAPDNK